MVMVLFFCFFVINISGFFLLLQAESVSLSLCVCVCKCVSVKEQEVIRRSVTYW